MKPFNAKNFYEIIQGNVSGQNVPYFSPNRHALTLLTSYYQQKYDCQIGVTFYNDLTEFYKSDQFAELRQQDNIRQSFIIGIDQGHAIPVLYVKENGKESLVTLSSTYKDDPQVTYAQNQMTINMYSCRLGRQADIYSCFNDAMIFSRDLTGKNEKGEYHIPDIIGKLDSRIDRKLPDGNFYWAKLPDELLKTAQISKFLDLHKEDTDRVIHKNQTLTQFRERYSNKPEKHAYLRLKGRKFKLNTEIQYYINEMQKESGNKLSPEIIRKFIDDCKEYVKTHPEGLTSLHQFAETFQKQYAPPHSDFIRAPDCPFTTAVQNGDVASIDAQLKEGFDVFKVDVSGTSPLERALGTHDSQVWTRIIAELQEQHVKFNSQIIKEKPLLAALLENKNWDAAKLVCANWPDIFKLDHLEKMIAPLVAKNDFEAVNQLLLLKNTFAPELVLRDPELLKQAVSYKNNDMFNTLLANYATDRFIFINRKFPDLKPALIEETIGRKEPYSALNLMENHEINDISISRLMREAELDFNANELDKIDSDPERKLKLLVIISHHCLTQSNYPENKTREIANYIEKAIESNLHSRATITPTSTPKKTLESFHALQKLAKNKIREYKASNKSELNASSVDFMKNLESGIVKASTSQEITQARQTARRIPQKIRTLRR